MKKVCIANRGEIACRILRACRDANLSTVAVYSDHDRSALHVALSDEAYPLGGNTPAESYLRGNAIIDIALRAGADAIHPGYGFLAENSSFARSVEQAGIAFIGPSADAIERLGDKTAARKLAQVRGVPTVPGTLEPLDTVDHARAVSRDIGYPILLKAAAGGGGKGMRIVERESDLETALRAARSEASGAFGDERIYVEKFLPSPRHIEIQVLADSHGNAVYLGERDCSVQRRHQKVVEESPSPVVSSGMRKEMGEAAVDLVTAAGYVNAGTVEFIVDSDLKYYFLEVNTRLQVEHPVTEMLTGIDLVAEQIRIANGEVLSIRQKDVRPQGAAIECRICAEDPANNFFPSSGTLEEYELPAGPFVRVENGFRKGDTIPVFYDSLLAKVITWGPDRSSAIFRMQRALSECRIAGVESNIRFCEFVLTHKSFKKGDVSTGFIQQHFKPEKLERGESPDEEAAALAASMLFKLQKGRRGNNSTTFDEKKHVSAWTAQRTIHHR